MENDCRQLTQVVVGEALKPVDAISVVGALDAAVSREAPSTFPRSPAGSACRHVPSGRSPPTCHSQVVVEAKSYYTVWLTLKDSETVDEFYKYPGDEPPQVGEVIKVVRFLRDRPTRARVTGVDTDFHSKRRITAIQID